MAPDRPPGMRRALARPAAEPTRWGAMPGADVPRVFLLVMDLVALAMALETAYILSPEVKRLLMTWPAADGIVAALSPDAVGVYPTLREVVRVLLIVAPMTVMTLRVLDAYRPILSQSRTRIVVTSLVAPLMGLSAITVVLFAFRDPTWSRLFIFSFTFLAAVGIGAGRLLLRAYRARRLASGFYAKNVVLIGPVGALERMAGHFQRTMGPKQYQVVGYLQLPRQMAVDPASGLTLLGPVEDFASILVHRPIHEVVAIEGDRAIEWLPQLIEACDYFRVTLRIVPEALLAGTVRDLQYLYHSDPLRLPEIVLRPRDLDSDALFVKRLLDIVVSAVLLAVLSPLLLLIAAAIKISTPRLPIFYPWQVVGYKGRRFTGYKFSTMVADADLRQHDLLGYNEMRGPVFKMKRDPRVTPVGRFLRKFSLNELPQLWSVLKGDMSLVGPRPAFPHELQRYELWHKRKLCVRPGMTCLWQVSGRNAINDFDEWVRLDLEYIDKWSLWLDVKILVWTMWAVVGGTGS